ncbi:MAG: hypothetical protein ACXVZQ_00585 [Terriglobales bacterium]
MLRSALLVTALLAAGLATAAESADPHYSCPRTGAIARRSAFVHGYLHGYEQGFHLADVDIQLGRSARDIRRAKEAKESEGYRHVFGDKHSFQAGFREGLRVGYADGCAGRAFRAVDQVESLFLADTGNPSADPVFDRGFSMGYFSGQQRGLEDGRSDVSFSALLPQCPPAPSRGIDRQSFCTAYVGGYRVGYSDGFTNVARPAAAQVEDRVGK